jgi:hypothetical protein
VAGVAGELLQIRLGTCWKAEQPPYCCEVAVSSNTAVQQAEQPHWYRCCLSRCWTVPQPHAYVTHPKMGDDSPAVHSFLGFLLISCLKQHAHKKRKERTSRCRCRCRRLSPENTKRRVSYRYCRMVSLTVPVRYGTVWDVTDVNEMTKGHTHDCFQRAVWSSVEKSNPVFTILNSLFCIAIF